MGYESSELALLSMYRVHKTFDPVKGKLLRGVEMDSVVSTAINHVYKV